MKRTLILLALTGCLVGDEAETIDDNSNNLSGGNAGDLLQWKSVSSACARSSHSIVPNGPALTVLFDQGTKWTQCTFTATLRVPWNVRLVGLTQQVRTEGTQTPIKYSARLNGTMVTAKTTNSRDTLDAYANLRALGDALCRKPGKGFREIPVSFSAQVDGTGVSLDSVDWGFDADDC